MINISKRRTNEQFLEYLKERNKNIFDKLEVIGEYSGKTGKIECRCRLCEATLYLIPNELYLFKECKKCIGKHDYSNNKRLNTKDFIQKVQDKYKDEIEFDIIGNYFNSSTPIECKCKKDKTHIFERKPEKIMAGHIRCPFCNNQKVDKEINCLAITDPWILKFLKNKEDGYKYSKSSRKRVVFKCPDCGNEKELYIYQVYTNGFSCSFCGKKNSLPNRILYGLMKELKNKKEIKEFEREYAPKWFEGKNYRYDGYIVTNNNINILLEFDGSQHTQKKNPYYSEEREKIDKIKDEKAIENGYEIIRIDCTKSNLNHIKNNIIKSKLKNFVNLKNINWNSIFEEANNSELERVCDYYKKHLNYTLNELAKGLGIDRTTLRKYLKMGTELGKIKEYDIKNANSKKSKNYRFKK